MITGFACDSILLMISVTTFSSSAGSLAGRDVFRGVFSPEEGIKLNTCILREPFSSIYIELEDGDEPCRWVHQCRLAETDTASLIHDASADLIRGVEHIISHGPFRTLSISEAAVDTSCSTVVATVMCLVISSYILEKDDEFKFSRRSANQSSHVPEPAITQCMMHDLRRRRISH